jgi:hypothetical protein
MTKIMKWVSITMLLLAVLQLRVANHPVLLEIVVCVSSLLIAAQATRVGKYSWAVGFLAIARAGRDILWIDAVGLAAFLTAVVAFKARPALTVLSITSHLPRRESL